MNHSRKKLIATLLVGCVIAVTLGLLFLPPSYSDGRLIVVGYTNELRESISLGHEGYSSWMPKVIVAITNGGTAPIRTALFWEAYPEPQIPPTSTGFLTLTSSIPLAVTGSYLHTSTLELSPGTATSVISYLPCMESDGRLKVAYTRLDWRAKLSEKAQSSRHAMLRDIASKLFPTKLHWTQSDVITNPPSFYGTNLPSPFESRPRRFHITAPPPDIPIVLPSPSTKEP